MTPIPSPQETPPSFLRRISLAIGVFFRTLSDARFALRLMHLDDAPPPAPAPPPRPAKAPAPAVVLREATPDAALQLLALLQREARLIDFAREDLAGHADADVGAAARLVHDGCAKVLREHFTIVAVRDEAEGSGVTLNDGFDAAAIRLTGNVVGKAPYRGSLSHRGWRATDVRLPRLAERHDARVLAPAEVEL